jgi:hypothetical protein
MFIKVCRLSVVGTNVARVLYLMSWRLLLLRYVNHCTVMDGD